MQIDLKHAVIYLKDGSTTAGNAAITGAKLSRQAFAGDTRIFTAMTGLVAINQSFTITGEDATPPTHLVAGFTQTNGNTTSISFAVPLLADLPAGTALTITALAATGANILEVRIGDGNLSYTEKQNIDYRRNRNLLDTVREGQEEPVALSFDLQWEFLKSTGGEPPTIEEALKRSGAAASWVSSSIDPCEPYAVDIEVHHFPACTTIDGEIVVFKDFRWESLDHSVKDGTIACKGNCNISRATSTRVSSTTASALRRTPGMALEPETEEQEDEKRERQSA